MIDKSINKLESIQENIKKLSVNNPLVPQIICVSKTFSINTIKPLIDYGHIHFGENKVQEADEKWSEIRKINNKIKLHMVGKLQSNKAKKAVEVFDFIHSLENEKLAKILKKSEDALQKKLSYFIQVNIAKETQKSGILPKDLNEFTHYCINEAGLNVIGLMILPPFDVDPKRFFEETLLLNNKLGLKHLSMGMSADYKSAVKYKSTFVRIGSAIMGPRKVNQ